MRVHLGGVCVADVAICTMSVSAVPVSSVPVSVVPDVGDTADRHRGEASGTQREGEPIQVHTLNTTRRTTGW
jgi:hypothetical protein